MDECEDNMNISNNKWANVIKSGLILLTTKDQKKLIVLIVIQIFLSFIDLLAIFLLGVVSYLAISGIGIAPKSNKILSLLQTTGLKEMTFQKQVLILALFGVTLFIFKSLTTNLLSKKILVFLATRSAYASNILLSKYLNQSNYRIIHSNKSDAIYALSEGVDLLLTKNLALFISFFSDFLLVTIVGIGLFAIDPIFTLGILSYFLIIGVSLYRYQAKFSFNYGLTLSKTRSEISDKIFELHENYREIKSRGANKIYKDRLSELRKIQSMSIAKMSFFQLQSKYIFEASIVLGALVFSALQFIFKDIGHAVTSLAIFLTAGMRLAPTIMRIQNNLVQLNGISGNSVTTASISEIADLNVTAYFAHVDIGTPDTCLVLKNVSFKYPESTINTLDGINLEIKSNSFVAITGPTGAGKSTLLDLCLGFLVPNHGEVKLYGQDPSHFITNNPGSISIIPQRVNIIKGTIKENIILGFESLDKSDDFIWDLLKKVQLFDFVNNLPNKLNSTVGEFGSKISGGQRQRIGIARALYTEPRIIGFDEATSSLDAETEQNISDMLIELKGSFTMLTIAHRLSSVMKSDLLLYLENGKMLASGSFNEVRNKVKNFDNQANLMGL
jgi:ABC-type multidrug transport system fused ATPase/permease subunit